MTLFGAIALAAYFLFLLLGILTIIVIAAYLVIFLPGEILAGHEAWWRWPLTAMWAVPLAGLVFWLWFSGIASQPVGWGLAW